MKTIFFFIIISLVSFAQIKHSKLDSLNADDHPQYHNDTRGDARYYTQTQLDSIELAIRDAYNAKFEGVQAQLTAGNSVAGVVLTPTTDDTLLALWTNGVKRVDSITIQVDDSATIQGKFGTYGYGTNLFSSAQLITSYSTITSFNSTIIPDNNQLAFYFTALGDGVTSVRWILYLSPDSTNLIIEANNASFEGTLGYWAGDFKLTSSDTSSEQASVGTYSMKLVSDGTGTGSIILNNLIDSVITKSTGTVLLSADIYSDVTGVRVRGKDKDGNFSFTDANTSTGTWQSVSCYMNGTFTGVSALAVIVPNNATIYIDNIRITKQ